MTDMFTLVQDGGQPVTLLAINGIAVICVEENDTQVVSKVHDAISRLSGEGEEAEEVGSDGSPGLIFLF